MNATDGAARKQLTDKYLIKRSNYCLRTAPWLSVSSSSEAEATAIGVFRTAWHNWNIITAKNMYPTCMVNLSFNIQIVIRRMKFMMCGMNWMSAARLGFGKKRLPAMITYMPLVSTNHLAIVATSLHLYSYHAACNSFSFGIS